MTQLVLNDLEDDVREKLQALARSHGRSLEEEAREILRGAVATQTLTETPRGIGSRMASHFAGIGLEESERIQELRGDWAKPPDFDR